MRALAEEMLAQKQVADLPTAAHPAFRPSDSDRWRAVRIAHEQIGQMFWGPRLSVEEACTDIRTWLVEELG